MYLYGCVVVFVSMYLCFGVCGEEVEVELEVEEVEEEEEKQEEQEEDKGSLTRKRRGEQDGVLFAKMPLAPSILASEDMLV